jgi:hypothetical protein
LVEILGGILEAEGFDALLHVFCYLGSDFEAW